MDNNVLYDTIDIKMRLRGIKEYRIEGMSINNGNLDVRVKPKEKREITISVNDE